MSSNNDENKNRSVDTFLKDDTKCKKQKRNVNANSSDAINEHESKDDIASASVSNSTHNKKFVC